MFIILKNAYINKIKVIYNCVSVRNNMLWLYIVSLKSGALSLLFRPHFLIGIFAPTYCFVSTLRIVRFHCWVVVRLPFQVKVMGRKWSGLTL